MSLNVIRKPVFAICELKCILHNLFCIKFAVGRGERVE